MTYGSFKYIITRTSLTTSTDTRLTQSSSGIFSLIIFMVSLLHEKFPKHVAQTLWTLSTSVHLSISQNTFEMKEFKVKQTSQGNDPINVTTHVQ